MPLSDEEFAEILVDPVLRQQVAQAAEQVLSEIDDIRIRERQACSECGRRLLNIINGMCFKCTADALARLRESSQGLAEQYQIIIMEQHNTQVERDALYAQVAEMAQIVRQVGAERDAAVSRSVTAKFAVGVLRDALLAYMEPAGDTPEELRKQAKSALRFAEKALPTVPPLQTIDGHG